MRPTSQLHGFRPFPSPIDWREFRVRTGSESGSLGTRKGKRWGRGWDGPTGSGPAMAEKTVDEGHLADVSRGKMQETRFGREGMDRTDGRTSRWKGGGCRHLRLRTVGGACFFEHPFLFCGSPSVPFQQQEEGTGPFVGEEELGRRRWSIRCSSCASSIDEWWRRTSQTGFSFRSCTNPTVPPSESTMPVEDPQSASLILDGRCHRNAGGPRGFPP